MLLTIHVFLHCILDYIVTSYLETYATVSLIPSEGTSSSQNILNPKIVKRTLYREEINKHFYNYLLFLLLPLRIEIIILKVHFHVPKWQKIFHILGLFNLSTIL